MRRKHVLGLFLHLVALYSLYHLHLPTASQKLREESQGDHSEGIVREGANGQILSIHMMVSLLRTA